MKSLKTMKKVTDMVQVTFSNAFPVIQIILSFRQISLKSFHMRAMGNISALLQVMDCHGTGDRELREPKLTKFYNVIWCCKAVWVNGVFPGLVVKFSFNYSKRCGIYAHYVCGATATTLWYLTMNVATRLCHPIARQVQPRVHLSYTRQE